MLKDLRGLRGLSAGAIATTLAAPRDSGRSRPPWRRRSSGPPRSRNRPGLPRCPSRGPRSRGAFRLRWSSADAASLREPRDAVSAAPRRSHLRRRRSWRGGGTGVRVAESVQQDAEDATRWRPVREKDRAAARGRSRVVDGENLGCSRSRARVAASGVWMRVEVPGPRWKDREKTEDQSEPRQTYSHQCIGTKTWARGASSTTSRSTQPFAR